MLGACCCHDHCWNTCTRSVSLDLLLFYTTAVINLPRKMNAGTGADTHLLLPHIAIAGAAAASTIDRPNQPQEQAVGNYGLSASDEPTASKTSFRDVDAAAACGSGRVRIQPIDTRIRLHMKQTQVGTVCERILGM